jgi:hypothetical protein
MVGRWRSMKAHSSQPYTLTIAQRGAIVQRVIVDGWTVAEVAAAAGLPERLVADWVADFRRRGMASLRYRPSKSVAAGYLHRRLLWPARLLLRGCASAIRWLLAVERRNPPSPIRQPRDDRRGGP